MHAHSRDGGEMPYNWERLADVLEWNLEWVTEIGSYET